MKCFDPRVSICAILLLCAGVARGAYTGLVMFGDSLSDVGNVYDQTFGFAPSSPPYFNGRYSNGPLWVEKLASELTLSAPVPSRDTGGRDYAYAGVKTGGGSTFIFPFSFPNLGSQINTYLSGNTPTATQLFTVWGGGNDFIDGQTNPSVPVNNIVSHVTALANAGAKNIVVPNLPPLGLVPRFRGTANESVMNSRTTQFNTQLAAAMSTLELSLNINIFQLDVAGFFNEALSNPASFGFTNVTGTALVDNTPAPNQDEYLFWDDIHPTRVGHALLGSRAADLVNTHSWASTASGGSWHDSTNWDPQGVPEDAWIAQIINVQPTLAQAVAVSSDSAVSSITVAGNQRQMTLLIQSGVKLSADSVSVNSLGRIDLLGAATLSGATTVHSGGRLGGSGTIDGDLAIAGGTVAPGDPGNVLNVSGNFETDGGAALEIELAGATLADRLNVAGNAALDGTLSVQLTNGFIAYPGLSFTVLTFASRTGDQTVVNDTGLAGLGFTKTFQSTALVLETTGTAGDANLDGTVNLDDFNALASNFGTAGNTWLEGDFTFDGLVNLDDFNLLAGNFGLGAGPDGIVGPEDWSALASAIPEPSGVLLGGAGLGTLLHRRRRSERIDPATSNADAPGSGG